MMSGWGGCATLANRKTVNVTVVGSLHRFHLDPIYGFSLNDLQSTVKALQPQLLCLEVDPQDEDTNRVGLYPPETVVLKHLARELFISSAAVDWRADFKTYKELSPLVKASVDQQQKELMDRATKSVAGKYDFFISTPAKQLIQKIHDTILKKDGEAADGFWITRNSRIAERCMTEARKIQASNVVFVFGVDHQYILEDTLSKFPDVKVNESSIRHGDPTWVVAQEIVDEWKNRLSALKELQNSSADPMLQKRVEQSGRIKELELFIRSAAFAL